MKRLNSKGFSPVEVLLVLVVIALVVGTGYFVYNSQKKTNATLKDTAKSQGEPQKATKALSNQPNKHESTSGSYAIAGKTLTYTPPKDWTVEEKAENNGAGDKWWTITLKSPDYKAGDSETMCARPTGTLINISVSATTKSNDTLTSDRMSNDEARHGYSFVSKQRLVDMAGQKAVEFVWNPGECDDKVNTQAVVNGYLIDVGAEAPDSSSKTPPYLGAPYDEIYKNLVASIKFN